MGNPAFELGPQEVKLLFTLEQEGKGVFHFDDILRILDCTESAAWNLVHRLKGKGRIEQIEKGKYLLIPARAGLGGTWSEAPYLIVPELLGTYYIAYWSAMNHWNLTEQTPRTVFVATTKRKRDVEYGPSTFHFVTLAERKFFGWTTEQMAGGTFRISDPEKTMVDCLDFPHYAGGLPEVVKALWEGRDRLDFEKVLEHAERYGVNVLIRRLGYLLEVLGIGDDVAREIASRDLKGYMWLDPKGPEERLGYAKDYGLILNRTRKQLTSWRGT